MDGKIKFGFSKVIKKPNLVNLNGENLPKVNKIELIEAIEGSSMKISGKNPEDEIEKKLIIPMTNDQKTTPLAKLLQEKTLKKLKILKAEPSNGNEVPMEVDVKQEPINETLDQQAARELVEDLQKKTEKSETKVFEVPMNADELPLDGAKESSIDDYERVPIGDFGKAMLRGMGWKDVEKKEDSKEALEGPILRPKGMGLGADKVIKKQPLLIAPNQTETLEIKRNACIKILAGKHKSMYGTIEGFDDGGGRVIIKLAIGGLKMTMNEFMVQPVGKAEYAKYAKILNSEKYEEFKAGGDGSKTSSSTVVIKQEPETSKPRRDRTPERQRKPSRSPERQRRQSRSPERHRNKSRSRSRGRDRSGAHKSKSHNRDRHDNSSDVRKYRGRSRSRDKHARKSSSDDDRSHKKKSSKHKRHHSSPDSRYSSNDEKKHKKKSKKSKQRKRDRS